MTVGQKLHQCLAQLEGATASLKTFCLDTQDPTAQKLYAQLSDTLQHQIIDPLKSRVNYVESQEPQYKVFQQAMQQGEMPEPHQPEQYDQ
jgi:hypothetical protein